MKLLLFILISFQLSFAASAEKVEQYLLVSSSDEELLALESQFSAMQNGFSTDANGEKKTYDMQLLSIRFNEYIQQHLSDNEMDKILENYKNVVYLQFVSTAMHVPEANETEAYIDSLKNDDEAKARLEILEEVNTRLNNKDSMSIMFDALMKPLLQSASGGMSNEMMKKRREAYMKNISIQARKETLYNLKDFSIEELEELLKVVKTPAMSHELKAIYGATAYALKEFFLSMASRYDVSKHQPPSTTDTNDTK